MPTNVKLNKKPENVQHTKWAEMPPKYKSKNVSTNIKFRENHLLENVDSASGLQNYVFCQKL